MNLAQIQQFIDGIISRKIFDVELGVWLSAIFLLLLGIALRGWLTNLILDRLDRLARRTSNSYDDEILQQLRKPLELLFLLGVVYVAISIIPLHDGAKILADKVLNSIGIFAVFRGFWALIDPLFKLMRNLNTRLDRALIGWLGRIVRVLILLLGGAAIGEVWGVPVGSVLAGLGLVGAAVALGAQDLFKNLISGIMIIAERRIEVGDWIKVEGIIEGTVESIGFRSSRVSRFDLGPVYVPNSHLADNPMINFSRRDKRRIYMKLGLHYNSSVETLEQIRDKMREWIIAHPNIANPDQISTFVNIDSYDDSSIGLMIYCFTTTTNWGEWLAIKEEMLFAATRIVAEAGSSFAYPSRSIYIEPTEQTISQHPAEK